MLNFNKNLIFLDKGFNIQTIGTKADIQVDLLDINAIRHLKKYFDIVYSFDTLEHISNPFRFCEHLVYITKPSGYIYISTVFEWPYHPSPDDYFWYSPEGLRECFKNPTNHFRNKSHILWGDWETDRRAVALIA